MRLSLLLKKEPIGEYIESSLTQFLDIKYNKVHAVKWIYKQKNDYLKHNLFYCNIYLNAIYHKDAYHCIFTPIKNEYYRSSSFFKRPFQYLYVYFATNFFTKIFFASPAIYINPVPSSYKSILIMGGNHHIRINAYDEKKSFVIAKNQYSKEFISNEINVRTQYKWLPSPMVISVASDNNWYEESIINGIPHNRISDEKEASKLKENLIKVLLNLYNQTFKNESIHMYSNSQYVLINKLLCKNKNIGKTLLTKIKSLTEKILFKIKGMPDFKIPIVITHGDFQSANMMLVEGKSMLIDWEYSAERSITYDFLTLYSGIRMQDNTLEKLVALINGKLDILLLLHQYIKLENVDIRKSVILIFLLEDIVLKLKENCNPDLKDTDSRLLSYYNLLADINEKIAL